MNTIRMKCQTLGRGFGDIVKVGNKDGEISKEDAKRLVDDGHAEVLADIVVTSSKELKRDLEALKVSNNKLDNELEYVKAELENTKGELEAAKAELENTKGELEAAKAGSKPKANGKP